MLVELHLNKTVEENAALYYEKAKKAKKKAKGAEKTVEKFKSQKIEVKEKPQQVQKEKRKLHWFEKFRWFLTSSGTLVVGGRDATTNEVVIKKHTDKSNLVFHTDMAGSPFFVIKSDKASKEDIEETADATVTFSRAWKNGLSTNKVFYVKPEQVTKEANTGEYLTKGAFMIRGDTTYVTNSVNASIGVIKEGEYKGLIMCGPTIAVQKHCDKVHELRQGSDKTSNVAKVLKADFGCSADDITKVLPPGGIELVKRRKRKHEL